MIPFFEEEDFSPTAEEFGGELEEVDCLTAFRLEFKCLRKVSFWNLAKGAKSGSAEVCKNIAVMEGVIFPARMRFCIKASNSVFHRTSLLELAVDSFLAIARIAYDWPVKFNV